MQILCNLISQRLIRAVFTVRLSFCIQYKDFTGYEERSYSERFTREDGSHIDIAACARKDAPGIVAIYYYTSPEFARNYTLTIQGLLNGYSTQKDGTIIVADEGIVVASNDESLLGQNTADNEVVQE